jgi:hypothetical protein
MIGWLYFLIALFFVTLLLILVDMYVRSQSFFMFRLPSFYLLLAIIYLINFFASYLLVESLHLLVLKNDFVLVLFLSTFATMAILQSFSLRFGNYQIINVDDLIEDLKNSVLADISRLKVNQLKKDVQTTALKLSSLCENENELSTQYLMTIHSGTDFEKAEKEITDLKQYCENRNLDFKLLLAHRITQADLERAKNLICSKAIANHKKS